MKKILLLLLALLSFHSINAKQISENEAAEIARNFFKTNSSGGITKSDVRVSLAHEFKADEATLMYAFNTGNNGYVLVSGDDQIFPVLGYTENGLFDYNTLPDNARTWFDMYTKMIKSVKDGKSKAFKTYPSATSVEPLVTCKWNQDYPYWNLTPIVNGNQSVTGCAATAMAQIAYYHKWPISSTGEINYETETYNIPIQTTLNTTFDWANMTDTYSNSSSEESCNAVAQLMRDIGYAMDMDYTDEMSGCTQNNIAKAIVTHLGYDKGLRIHYAITHEEEDWAEMLKDELDARRPILYCGVTQQDEGHAFVCDGYDTDGLFHINWGWGGVSDGYFVITALDPESQGLGGASSGAGFNTSQCAIMSIQKPVENSVAIPYTMLYTDGMMNVTETDVELVLQDLQNAGYGEFSGAFWCDIITPDMTVVKQIKLDEDFVCPEGMGGEFEYGISKAELISGLEDGVYAFYLYTIDLGGNKVDVESTLEPFAFQKEGDEVISLFTPPVQIALEHRNAQIQIEDDIAYLQVVIANVTEVEEEGDEEDDEEEIATINVNEDEESEEEEEGDGDSTYTGPIFLDIYNSDDQLVAKIQTQDISIAPGDAIILQLAFSVVSLPEDEYYIELTCKDGNIITPSKAPELHFEIDRKETSIEEVEINNSNKLVNVVAVDGRVIKQNVKASEASQGLAPGIYFIGNKKVFIK